MRKIILLIFVLLFNATLIFSQVRSANLIDREFNEAENLFFQRKYNFSREAFLFYLRKRPLSTNDMLYYYIGATYFQDKQYENAIKYYKIAFDLKDSYSHANSVANSYYQIENYKESLLWYRRSTDRIRSLYDTSFTNTITVLSNMSENTVTNILYIGTNNLNSIDIKNIYSFQVPIIENTISITNEATNNSINTVNNISPSNNTNTNDIFNTDVTNVFSNLTNENIILTNTFTSNITNNNQKNLVNYFDDSISKMFTVENIFTNSVMSNVYTNTVSITNKSLVFTRNNNMFLQNLNAYSADTNSQIMSDKPMLTLFEVDDTATLTTNRNTNTTTNMTTISKVFGTNVITTFDNVNTIPMYYSAYLHMGHAYIKLKDYESAAMSYEIFLTNAGENYYQKDSLSKVITLIRENESKNTFDELTNKLRVITNESDLSITTDLKDFDNITRKSTVFTNGDKTTFTSFPNGNKIFEYINTNNASVKETMLANGEKYIDTLFADGSIKKEKFNKNTIESIWIKTHDNNIYEYIANENGIPVNKMNITENGENKIVVARYDGSISQITKSDESVTYYNRGSFGDEIKRVEYNDGSSLKEVYMPDGSVIHEKKNTDGSINILANYSDGSIKKTTTDSEGLSSTEIILADGSKQTRVSKDFEQFSFEYRTVADDGSIIIKSILEDGTTKIQKQNADGSSSIESIITDGTVLNETKLPDGSIVQYSTALDGTTKKVTTKPSGEKIEEIVKPDGSTSELINYADGATELKTTSALGEKIIDKKDNLGNSNITTSYTDGRVVSKIVKVDGTVIDIESNNGIRDTKIIKNGMSIIIKEAPDKDRVVEVFNSLNEGVDEITAKSIIEDESLKDFNIDISEIVNILVVEAPIQEPITTVDETLNAEEDNTLSENVVDDNTLSENVVDDNTLSENTEDANLE